MAEVETQQVSDISEKSGGSDKAVLLERLDELLEQYLHTLDSYQKAQQELASNLSSGYMSIAQANFSNQARTRYGKDYYDERMQATRTVTITEDQSNLTYSVSKPEPDVKDQQPEPEGDSLPEETPEEKVPPSKTDEKGDPSSNEDKTRQDPLRWFGILVQPALRAAQTSFTSAVEGPVIELANISKALKNQEIEIGKVRKAIRKM